MTVRLHGTGPSRNWKYMQVKAKFGTRSMSPFNFIVLIGFAIFGIHYWLNNKSYIFEAKDVARIAERHARKGKHHFRFVIRGHIV